MTPATVFEREVASESALAVVTGQTRHTPRRDEVFGGRGRANLPRLGRARS